MRSSKLTSFAAGALCMLVLGSGSAVAATGGKFILGRSNGASTTTTLSNTRGTALSLKAPSNKAPLAVSNGVKVPNLNSDRVDGVSSESFARVTGGTGTREATSQALSLDPASDLIDTLVADVSCPAGTVLTGGGYNDNTQTGIILESAPGVDPSQWEVAAAVDPNTTEDPQDLTAYAVCYNPRGAVAAQAVAQTTLAQARAATTPELAAAVGDRSSQ